MNQFILAAFTGAAGVANSFALEPVIGAAATFNGGWQRWPVQAGPHGSIIGGDNFTTSTPNSHRPFTV